MDKQVDKLYTLPHGDEHAAKSFVQSGKKVAYASLATMTLVAGMGATPVILADELNATQPSVEQVADQPTTTPVIQTPVALPTAPLDDQVTATVPKNEPTAPKAVSPAPAISASDSPGAKSAIPKAMPKAPAAPVKVAAKQASKDARVATTLTIDDFNIEDDTIVSFSDKFWTDVYPTWDGTLNFDQSLAAANVTAIGDAAFYGADVAALDFTNFTTLQSIGALAFYQCNSLTSINFNGATSLQTIGTRAFFNCENLTDINFTGATSLTSIGEESFRGCADLTALDLSPLASLVSIGDSAFTDCPSLTSINFTGLDNLESIGDYAFEGSNVAQVDLVGLSNLSSIGVAAFMLSPNLQTVNMQNLPLLTTTGDSIFQDCENLTTLNFANLPALTSIGDSAFSANNLTALDLSPLTNLITIEHAAFSNSAQLPTVNFSGLSKLETIGESAFAGSLNLASVDLSPLTNLKTLDEFAFDSTALTEIDLSPLTKLTSIGRYAFGNNDLDNTDLAPTMHVNLQRVIIGDNPNLTVAANAFYRTKSGGMVIPATPSALENAVLIRDNINNGSIDWADEADNWYIAATVTYKFVDQNNQAIAAAPVMKEYTRIDNEYQVAAAPAITGYENPQLIGAATILIDSLWQDVTYKYDRAHAQAFTVYRVDTDGNNLVAPEELTGNIDAILDLTPRSFAGYDFQALYSGTATNMRAITDFTWQTAHELINSKINYNDNDGRSYKFVYAKHVDVDTNNPETPTDNGQQPTPTPGTGTGTGTDNDKQPSNPGKTPTHLPGSGGKPSGKQQPSNTGSKPGVNQATPVTKQNTTTLPKSGNATTALIPALGAMVLASVFGLYALMKKRKS